MAEQTSCVRFELGAAERLLLMNQFAILERLYPALGQEFAAKRQIIEREEVEHYDLLFSQPAFESPRWTSSPRSAPLGAATDRGGALTPW